MKMWQLITHVLIGMALLITAIVLAVTGNMLGAIFTAIMWLGQSNNSNALVAYHQRQGTLPHQQKKADPLEQLLRGTAQAGRDK